MTCTNHVFIAMQDITEKKMIYEISVYILTDLGSSWLSNMPWKYTNCSSLWL